MNMSSQLCAGAAQIDITPAYGIQLAGDIGRYRPVEEIREPLYARALIIEGGGRKACLLSLDLCAITRQWADEIRHKAANKFGLAPEAIMIHVLQNHSAPSVGHIVVDEHDDFNLFPKEYPWLLGGDDRYNPVAVEGVLKAIGQAMAALQPVQVKVGRGVDGRVAFNRRFVMRDGTAVTQPRRCDPNILSCEGPVDPEVGVMLFTAKDDKPLAVLLHHTCHPAHGCPQRWVTSGWPGAWSDGVRQLCGAGCVPLVLNGFCGNIHHPNYLDPEFKDDYKEIGRKLTETTARILKNMAFMENSQLAWRVRYLSIPMRRPDEKEIEEGRRLLREHPEPTWQKGFEKIAADVKWVYAASQLDLVERYKRNQKFDYMIQVFRIGNVALVAVPGEPFVEEQLRIKLESPAAYTWMAHQSNGRLGYIPTLQAFKRGGYETLTSHWSKLVPEALTMIGDAVLEELRTLLGDGKNTGK